MTHVHGTIHLEPAKCTSCMLCVKECPTWCISLESHTEQVTEEGARRPKSVAVLDYFAIDFGVCMYCGICIDVCPFDALAWVESSDQVASTRAQLGTAMFPPSNALPDPA